MKFLNPKEKSQLQQILSRSSLLQTSDERRHFLSICGLDYYCGLIQLDQPLNKFIVSLCSTLSKHYTTVNNSKILALVVFLENINEIDISLSNKDKHFIQHVITQWEQWQASKTGKQQSEESSSPYTPIAHLRQDWGDAPNVAFRTVSYKTITVILVLLAVIVVTNSELRRLLKLDPSQPNKTSSTSSTSVKPDLKSRVDYRQLKNLLASREFKKANEETTKLMLQIADYQHDLGLDIEEIRKFPCSDLDTINQLWTYYSNGHFGLTAQRQIWTKVGQNPEQWGDRVGWRVNGKYLNYQELTFGLQAPRGHLPTRATLDTAWVIVGVEKFFFSRLDTCSK